MSEQSKLMSKPLPSSSDMTLQQYLDSLLVEPVNAAVATPAPRPYAEPVPTVRRALPPVAAEPVVDLTPAVAPLRSVAPVPTVAPAAVAVPAAVTADAVVAATVAADTVAADTATADVATTTPAPWQNGRPSWAQSHFEALLFSVGGLNLAVPLVELGTIYTLQQDDITPLFGQVDWFMGMLSGSGRSLRVVDTAQVVMPERYQPEMRQNYRYVIALHGTDWGLAVDRVANALPMAPDQVRWRTARSQRPWLAGTVVEHMCALLDPAQLGWSFQQQDRRRR